VLLTVSRTNTLSNYAIQPISSSVANTWPICSLPVPILYLPKLIVTVKKCTSVNITSRPIIGAANMGAHYLFKIPTLFNLLSICYNVLVVTVTDAPIY